MRELRPYQDRAARAVFRLLYDHDRVLVSHPMGTGKTVLGGFVAFAWPEVAVDHGRSRRVLWLAHRDELIWQAVREIEQQTGETPAVDKGEMRVSAASRAGCVVSSVQTMMRENRRMAYGPHDFGLLLVDEAHHVVAEHWAEVIEYFGAAQLVGMSGTCDRADEISLGNVFDVVADHYELSQAIVDGWLCPLRQEFIRTEVDFDRVRQTAAGDFSPGELEKVLTEEEPLHNIVSTSVKAAGQRQGVVFVPTVAMTEAVALIMSERYGAKAVAVSGKTDPKDRRRAVREFRDGKVQWLVNAMLFTEGLDLPTASCIVVARPTRSRLLYAQMVGRGLRGGRNCPVPGKTDCLVIDLVGASAKHKLTGLADLLAGKYGEEAVEEVHRICFQAAEDGEPADVLAVSADVAKRLDELRAAKRKQIMAEAKMKRKTMDPFALLGDSKGEVLLGLPHREFPGWWSERRPTDPMLNKLKALGIRDEGDLSYGAAMRLIDECQRREDQGVCSYRQARLLASFGYDTSLDSKTANKIIGHLMQRQKKEGRLRHTKAEAIAYARKKRGRK